MSTEKAIEYLRLAIAELEGVQLSDIESTSQEPQRKPEISLDSIYQYYPRKIGKKKGLQKLKKVPPDKRSLLYQAVLNYRNYCISQELDPQFIKHFSTWAGEWEDWIEAPTVINPQQEKRRIEKEKRELQRRSRDTQPTQQLTQEEKEANKERLADLMSQLADNMKP